MKDFISDLNQLKDELSEHNDSLKNNPNSKINYVNKLYSLQEELKKCYDGFEVSSLTKEERKNRVKITKENIKERTPEEILLFIRERLALPEEVISNIKCLPQEAYNPEHEHFRFNMTGYESRTGECVLYNLSILNKFADLGIYDYTTFLFLDFYKGTPTIYLQYFYQREDDYDVTVMTFDGLTTTEIIYEIFKLTILSDRTKRRRC